MSNGTAVQYENFLVSNIINVVCGLVL